MHVGFIGLGTMGAPMALNVLRGGFATTVHDLDRRAAEPLLAAGAGWARDAAELAGRADVVLTSLPGPPEVEEVAAGLLGAMRPGAAWFDLSTGSPVMIRRLHEAFARRGVHLLDAPVSGGPRGAASGRLAVWVGGDEAVFAERRPVLDAMGDQVRRVGPIGSGSVAKLVHNASGYAIQRATAEMFTAGVRAGVEPLALWRAIRQAPRRQRTFDGMADHFLVNDYDPPDFALSLALKDVSLAAELGRDMGVPTPLVDLTEADMREAVGRGWGGRDSRAFLLLQQERAGVEIAVEKSRVAEALGEEG